MAAAASVLWHVRPEVVGEARQVTLQRRRQRGQLCAAGGGEHAVRRLNLRERVLRLRPQLRAVLAQRHTTGHAQAGLGFPVYRARLAPPLPPVGADATAELAMQGIPSAAAPTVAARLVGGLLRGCPALALPAGGFPAYRQRPKCYRRLRRMPNTRTLPDPLAHGGCGPRTNLTAHSPWCL